MGDATHGQLGWGRLNAPSYHRELGPEAIEGVEDDTVRAASATI